MKNRNLPIIPTIIKKNTVFVLGAGASVPFGYPTGNALTQKICYDLQALGIAKLLTTENDERVEVEQAIIRLRQNFERSGKQSIDLFSNYPIFPLDNIPTIVYTLNGKGGRHENA